MIVWSRRQALMAGLAATAVASLPWRGWAQAPDGPFTLPPLPYAPDALEPAIDARTMELHHGRHHQAYVTNLNRALAEHSQLHGVPLRDLLARLDELPDTIRTAVRNHGGGHANHTMFWSIMGPPSGSLPGGMLAEAIARDFGSFDDMKSRFERAGLGVFGSGWVFVTVDPTSGVLAIETRPNQDTPLMDGRPVLFGNDVWEHAYYLQYQNRRADYLKAWWDVVNWEAVAARLAAIRDGRLDL